jgi:hypothetical protein
MILRTLGCPELATRLSTLLLSFSQERPVMFLLPKPRNSKRAITGNARILPARKKLSVVLHRKSASFPSYREA